MTAKRKTAQALEREDGFIISIERSNSNPVTLSIVTATTPAILSKRFELVDGALTKKPGGALARGHYLRTSVADPDGLAALIAELTPAQALAYGVASVEAGVIASKAQAQPGELIRNRDHFDWPAGPAVLMLDYDPRTGTDPLSVDALVEVLAEVCPAIAGAPSVIVASASTHVYEGEDMLRGAGGLRLLVLVADGRDIPRAGAVLADRLWCAGHGYFAVSKSGSLLARTLIDCAVWQPERLDFIAGAHCAPPLVQRRPAPIARNVGAPLLDTRAVLSALSSDAAQTRDAKRAVARLDVTEEAEQVRDEWIEERLATFVTDDDTEGDEARTRYREQLEAAVRYHRLMGDFELLSATGETVTVGDLLDDPDRWHGSRFADPLETDYGNDRRIACANLRSGGRPYIWSHAHGGQRFTLYRAPQTLQVIGGEVPRLLGECANALTLAGEVYQRGGELVRIADGELLPVSAPWLRTHLERERRFERYDGRAKVWRAVDCPGDLAERLRANRGAWPMPELRGLVHAPILRPDGTLLDRPGYDAATGLLLIDDHADAAPIPLEPTREQVRKSVAALLEPFAHFPLIGPLDWSLLLAACLTAVQRPMLPTAPAFGFNAYKAGSGKGKAAKAVAWLGGREPVESPWSTEPEEQRKRLMAKLLAGPPSLLIDNVNGQLDSDTLCAILTATTYEDRRLGFSESVSVSTRVLVLATGNNLQVVGDLGRRVLVATIDHGVEAPERLAFPFCPVQRVRERWRYYRAAALTILRGFIVAGMPRGGPGAMGSFEEWDAMIRQCVCWVRDSNLSTRALADPADAVSANAAADPDTQKLSALMHAWPSRSELTVAELIRSRDKSSFAGPFDCPLSAALDEIGGEGGDRINSRRLGRWIERHQGRVLDGYVIRRGGSRSGSALWKLGQ